MSAHTKRRRIPIYLSLPAVVAMVFLLAAKLVALQRAEIIADLTDRVEHRDADEAVAAVHQLGDMLRPPADVLVAAAAAADRKVANEAQQAIGKLLRRAQRQIDTGQKTKAVARQLGELAAALADQRHAFDAADEPWLVSTTERILRMANDIPAKHTPLIATHCDIILTSVRSADAVGATAQHADAEESIPEFETAVTTQPAKGANQDEPSKLLDAESDESVEAPWRGDWSQPVFRMSPAPVNVAPLESAPSVPKPSLSPDVNPPADVEVIERPLADDDPRTLLQQWFAAEGSEAASLEIELSKKRGFGRLSKPVVEKFFSSRAEERVQLVDDVLTTPGVNARPWLMLLADDADADVRYAAVTVMATSSDPVLVEKAWDAAIHDRDPRIAALAGRLRERRAETQRR